MKQNRRSRFASLAMLVSIGLLSAMFFVGTAVAQEEDPYSGNPPQVLPSVIEKPEPERPDAVFNERIPPPDTPPSERGPLPFTGADLTLFVATGLAAVATGSVIVRRTRSRGVQ